MTTRTRRWRNHQGATQRNTSATNNPAAERLSSVVVLTPNGLLGKAYKAVYTHPSREVLQRQWSNGNCEPTKDTHETRENWTMSHLLCFIDSSIHLSQPMTFPLQTTLPSFVRTTRGGHRLEQEGHGEEDDYKQLCYKMNTHFDYVINQYNSY